MAVGIVTFLFVNHESNYDQFHENIDKIYRVGAGIQNNALNDSMPNTVYQVGTNILNEVPEVKHLTRMVNWYRSKLVMVGKESFPKVNMLITDSMFIDVFSFPILQGNKNDFLKSPDKIAVSEKCAIRLFGNTDVLGKTIIIEKRDYEIAWLMKNPPHQSIIQFDILTPFTYRKELLNWLALDVHTYFTLSGELNQSTIDKIEKASNSALMERFGKWIVSCSAPILPFNEMYLYSTMDWEVGKTGNLKNLKLFSGLALLILLIAIVNYINLLTSRSEYRGKEVGVRKINGAAKNGVRIQFLAESAIVSIIALLFSFVLAESIVQLINKSMQINLGLLKQSTGLHYLVYFTIASLIGVLAGTYPAFVMTRFQPIKIIKGIFQAEGKSNQLKIALVMVQFSISTLLIIGILTMSDQIYFMKNKDMGFDADNLMIVDNMDKEFYENYDNIRNELLQHHHIKEVAGGQSVPGESRSGQSIRKHTDGDEESFGIQENRVKKEYIKTLGIEIIQGRDFNPDLDENRSIIINETAAKKLGVPNPVGLEVVTNRNSVIIGVMKDYHYFSAGEEIMPLYLSNYRKSFNKICIRVDRDDRPNTIRFVEKTLKKYKADLFWQYYFLDDNLKNQYKLEERVFNISMWVASIALFLSVLGLFALTSYTIMKKYKEIGIRKTLGASVKEVVSQLNKSILRWVLITNLIAWPSAWYFLNNWLNDYAYHVDLKISFFVAGSALSLLVAFLSISGQALKAARLCPSKAIRYE